MGDDMQNLENYEFGRISSIDDEYSFYAKMGYFFSSPNVRRDCGGYPLNNGPLYHWFVVYHIKDKNHILGFISIEETSFIIHIREGYIRREMRGLGLFKKLMHCVLEYIDIQEKNASVRIVMTQQKYLKPLGFEVTYLRGNWVSMTRKSNDKK